MFSPTSNPVIHLNEVTSLSLRSPGSRTGMREDGLVEIGFLRGIDDDMDIRFIDKDALIAFLRENCTK
jgi:hypothetical protein